MQGGIMIRKILLDIDILYEIWIQKFKKVFEKKLEFCKELYNLDIEYWRHEKSIKSGNTHVFIRLRKPVRPEIYHEILYCLGEDHRRLMWSYKRYLCKGKILDFFYRYRFELKKKT